MLAVQQANLLSKETSQPLKKDSTPPKKHRSQAMLIHRGNKRIYANELSFWTDLYTQLY